MGISGESSNKQGNADEYNGLLESKFSSFRSWHSYLLCSNYRHLAFFPGVRKLILMTLNALNSQKPCVFANHKFARGQFGALPCDRGVCKDRLEERNPLYSPFSSLMFFLALKSNLPEECLSLDPFYFQIRTCMNNLRIHSTEFNFQVSQEHCN